MSIPTSIIPCEAPCNSQSQNTEEEGVKELEEKVVHSQL